jgi:uncharacterized protein
MTAALNDVFADASFWIALVVKRDEFHERAQYWSQRIGGKIFTTSAVLLETANTLSRPKWRAHAVTLINRLQHGNDVEIVPLSPEFWQRGWNDYCQRPDKAWSLTDCISFLVMQDNYLTDALTTDNHFRQAGFRAVLQE